MNCRGIVALLTLAYLPCIALANPVARPAHRFNELIRIRSGPPDPELADHFAIFGLDGLSPESLIRLSREFHRFQPLLVRSQAPRTEGRWMAGGPLVPSTPLQDWYRERADATDREAMLKVLRAWLTVPAEDLDGYSSLVRAGSEESARRELLRTRLQVAEILADWRDTTGVPFIRALAESLRNNSLPPSQHREWWVALAQTLRRIEEPSTAGMLVPGARGCELHMSRADVASIELGPRAAWVMDANPRVDEATIRRIWPLLGRGRVTWPWPSGGVAHLVIRCRDGRVADLLLGSRGCFLYTDNSRLEKGPGIVIHNPALAAELDAIVRARSIP